MTCVACLQQENLLNGEIDQRLLLKKIKKIILSAQEKNITFQDFSFCVQKKQKTAGLGAGG